MRAQICFRAGKNLRVGLAADRWNILLVVGFRRQKIDLVLGRNAHDLCDVG
jgi:hypothetical protein